MKMTKSLITSTAVLLLTGSATAFAADGESCNFSNETRYFMPSLTAKAQTNLIHSGEGAVDFKKELNMDDTNGREYRFNWADEFRLSYIKLDYSGNSTLTKNLTYQTTTYASGTNVTSDLGITYLRGSWIRPIEKTDTCETYWMVDVKGFDLCTEVSGSGNSTSKTYRGLVPTVGAGTKWKMDDAGKLECNAEISGFPMGGYGHFYDAEAGIKYQITENIALGAGYRIIDLKIKNGSDYGECKLAGRYYGLDYKF